MTAYYNEIEPYAAQWLRNLIAAGHIAPGDVDERSIEDVTEADLRGYTQCHFFAGIGVWSYALRQAGWPDDKPVWTGSCPCQPFSAAGKRNGFADERHLWPLWHWFIEQCRPTTIFGEQSSRAAEWLNLVRSDLEGVGYSVGAMPIQAASAGAFHLRDRLWFVANSGGEGLEKRVSIPRVSQEMGSEHERKNIAYDASTCAVWFRGHDGKQRPIESSVHPLVNGAPSRVGRLRAYGNSIHVKTAEAFIRASMEAI